MPRQTSYGSGYQSLEELEALKEEMAKVRFTSGSRYQRFWAKARRMFGLTPEAANRRKRPRS